MSEESIKRSMYTSLTMMASFLSGQHQILTGKLLIVENMSKEVEKLLRLERKGYQVQAGNYVDDLIGELSEYKFAHAEEIENSDDGTLFDVEDFEGREDYQLVNIEQPVSIEFRDLPEIPIEADYCSHDDQYHRIESMLDDVRLPLHNIQDYLNGEFSNEAKLADMLAKAPYGLEDLFDELHNIRFPPNNEPQETAKLQCFAILGCDNLSLFLEFFSRDYRNYYHSKCLHTHAKGDVVAEQHEAFPQMLLDLMVTAKNQKVELDKILIYDMKRVKRTMKEACGLFGDLISLLYHIVLEISQCWKGTCAAIDREIEEERLWGYSALEYYEPVELPTFNY